MSYGELENLDPQPPQRVGVFLQCRRCNASLNSLSERQSPLTQLGGFSSHLLVSRLLIMVRLVAAGIGSVLRLSTSNADYLCMFGLLLVPACHCLGKRICLNSLQVEEIVVKKSSSD